MTKVQQIIQHRKGCIDKVKDINSYISEIIYGTGNIGDITGNVVFIGNQNSGSGNYSPISRIYFGTNAPTVNAYKNTLNGLPFYSVYDKTLYILNNPKNIDMDLSGNIFRRNIAPNNISASGFISGNSLNITGDVKLGKNDSNIIEINGKIKGSLIPLTSNTYDLGTPTNKWRNIYATLISGSFEGDGSNLKNLNTSMSVEVIGQTTSAYNISLPNEKLSIYTNPTNGINLTMGSKRIEIIPFNATYSQRGVSYYNNSDFIVNSGYVSIDQTKFNQLSSSFKDFTSSINTWTGSINNILNNFSVYTSSFNTTFNNYTSSVSSSLNSLNSYTSSNNVILNNFSVYTSSFNTTFSNFSSSVNTQFINVNTTINNLSTYTSSINNYSKVFNTALNQILVGSSSYSNTLNVNVLSNSNINLKLDDNLKISSSITTTNLIANGTLYSSGSAFVGGYLQVSGNLYVNGSVTVIDSINVNIGDNIIGLNAAGLGLDGGIYVYDNVGGTTTGSLLWDVTNNWWKAGGIGNEKRIVFQESNTNLTTNALTYANSNGRLISAISPTLNDIPIWNGSTWDNVNLSKFATTSSLGNFTSSLNSWTASLNIWTGSFSQSVNTQFQNVNTTLNNFSVYTSSFNTTYLNFSSSVNTQILNINDYVNNLNSFSASIKSYTSSINNFVNNFSFHTSSINIWTGSFSQSVYTQFQSVNTSLNNFSVYTSSFSTIFNNYTSSNNVVLNNLSSYTSSLNTATGSFFKQGGNSFGANAVIGTNDNNSFSVITSGSTRLAISSFGDTIVYKNLDAKQNLLIRGGTFIFSSLYDNGSLTGDSTQFLRSTATGVQWTTPQMSHINGLLNYTSSVSSSLNSLNLYTASNNVIINNLSSFSSSVNSWTGSTNTILNNLSSYTSSLNTATGSFFKQGGNSFGTSAVIGTNDNYSLSFETNGSVKAVIGTDGKFTLGTVSSPTALLNIGGDIIATGDVSAYSASDIRLKKNILRIENPSKILSKINGYTYQWNDKQNLYKIDTKDIGLIAQEVEKVLPEIVGRRYDGYKSIKYERIIAILVEGFNEMRKELDYLKGKI